MPGADASHERPVVVVPLGAWEQHGPHLPPDTDSVIVTAIVEGALEMLDDSVRSRIVVAPVVPITASDEHLGLGATLSTGTEAFAASLVGIGRSASTWASCVVFTNGHGGNHDALTRARHALAHEGIAHRTWSPTPPPGADGDLHAGWVETSVMLHLVPDRVDMTRATAGATGDAASLVAAMRDAGVAAVSANGVVGDPRGAEAARGARILDDWRRSLAATLASAVAGDDTAR